MSVESLRKTGLYFDDLNKIRVLDPEASQKTNLLKDECKEYVNSKYILIFFFTLNSIRKYNLMATPSKDTYFSVKNVN